MANYRQEWDDLINALLKELIKINNLPKKSMEDIWVEGTIKSVLKQMCALHKLKPSNQQIDGIQRELFTPFTADDLKK